MLAIGEDIFADDDGVIDDNAEHDDESEEGYHIDGDIKIRQEEERAEEGNGDTHGGPKS